MVRAKNWCRIGVFVAVAVGVAAVAASVEAQSTAERLASLYDTAGADQNGRVSLTQYADDATDAGAADAYLARMAEPAPKAKPKPAPRPAPRSDALAGMFQRGTGLAGTPNMFGDFLNLGGQIFADDLLADAHATAPLLGGARRVKICENNSSLPQDRVYFLYNHFENALVADASNFVVDPARRGFAVDRYSFGVEKTFRDQLWSAELRMPFTGGLDFQTQNFSTTGGNIGNLALILKRKIYENECTVMAAGLGLDFPTGSDAYGHVNVTDWRIQNQAVHLAPYIGLLRKPNDCFFWQGFLQIDVPLNGNAVDFDDRFDGPGRFGILDDQTLLFADLELGYWLHRNPCARSLTGLAAVVEFHFATTLQDADIVTGTTTVTDFAFGNLANRVEETNVTVGLHGDFANRTLCRVGAVFPLCWGDNRSFDAELQVQLERRF